MTIGFSVAVVCYVSRVRVPRQHDAQVATAYMPFEACSSPNTAHYSEAVLVEMPGIEPG
jgi:hypothetical protein